MDLDQADADKNDKAVIAGGDADTVKAEEDMPPLDLDAAASHPFYDQSGCLRLP